jgi:ribosomal protein L37AE/L43A
MESLLEQIHTCEKCKGKIVAISIDKLGVTRCGYCNAVVDYTPYYMEILKKNKRFQELINEFNKKREGRLNKNEKINRRKHRIL